eukprot:UN30148
MREAFDLFDTENKGSIDVKELKAAMRALGLDVKKDELRKIMFDLDKETTSEINYEEFIHIMTPRLPSRDTRDDCDRVFSLFDEEQSGFITFKNFKTNMSRIG